jgi:hypothetical protein
MDRIIYVTLCVLMVIATPFAGILAYTAYTEFAYRNTLSGNYTYLCTIDTDAPLYNVTLFIPVPVDRNGNSPIAAEFSSRAMKGIPSGWDTSLFDTGKSTLLKITVPEIIPPEGTTASHPYTVTFSSESASRTPIDTKNPVEMSAMFRPVQGLTPGKCPPEISTAAGAQCAFYTTSLYADYSAPADTITTIHASITGRNTWTVFELRSNEYHADVITVMKGSHKGWVAMEGRLSSGTGTYDNPAGA